MQSMLLQYSHGRICQLMYLKMKKLCQQVYCWQVRKLRIECMPWQYPIYGLYFDIDCNVQVVFKFVYALLQVRSMSFYMFIWNYVGSSRDLTYSQKFYILNISVNCNQSSFRVASSITQVSNFFLTISMRGLFQLSLTRQQLDPLIQISCKSNQYQCTSLTVNLELDSFTLYLSNFETAYQTNPHSANKLLDTVSLSKDLIICENLLYQSRKSRIGVCYYYPCILSIYYYIMFLLLSCLISHFSLLLTCILIYLSIPMFRYRLAPNFAYTKVRLAVGQTAVEAMVPPHPLFSQVKQIQLKNDETNLKCLELLQRGEVQIAIQNSTQFVKRCREVYNLNPQIVTEDVGLSLLLSNGEEGNKTFDLLAMLKTAFDSTGIKLHPKIMRKIKGYIKTSKRKSSEKEVLQKIIKSYKQDQKIEQDQPEEQKEPKKPQNKPQLKKKQSLKTSKPSNPQKPKQQNIQIQEQDEQTSQKISSHQARRKQRIDRKQQQQQLKPTIEQFQDFADNDQEVNPKGRGRDNRMRQSKSRNNRSKDGYQGRGGVSREKRFDPKIMLGISGDTEAGWRERNRPPRVPARPTQQPYQQRPQKYGNKQYQSKQYQKQENRRYNENPRTQLQPQSQSQSQFQKPKQQQINQSSPSRQIKLNSKTGLLFTFPKDGQTFDFSQIQQSFKLFINGSFWVNYNNGVLQIVKGSNGYRRDSKIDVISNGFMAEGLTLSLSGHSNLQDGGEAIGNPSIQEFTGNQSQFFPVVTLDVYKYDSNLSANTQNENSVTFQNQIPKQKKVDNQPSEKQADLNKQGKSQNVSKKVEGKTIQDNQNLKVPKKALSPKKSQGQQEWEDVSEGASSSMQPQPQKSQQQQQIQQVQQKPAQKAKQQQTRQSRRQRKSGGGDNKYKSYKGKQHLGDEEEFYQEKRSRSRGSNSSRGIRGSGRGKGREVKLDKSKIDPMIMLGINGDSEEGWRRKQRPEKYSKRNNDRDQHKKEPKTQFRKKSEQTTKKDETYKQKEQSHSKPQKSQSKQAQKQSEHMEKQIPEETVLTPHSEVAEKHKTLLVSKVDNNPPIFTYNKDGQNFDFSKLKNGFKLYINKSFWVKYSNGHLEIKKGNDAFVRQCNIDFIQNGFMGQGLTVRLGESCNLQDGGEIQGNPSIQQFTGNQTQFFYVNSMQVYPF